MVNPALLASVDALDADELEELIEYAANKRIDDYMASEELRATLEARRNDANPANWLTDEEFESSLDKMFP